MNIHDSGYKILFSYISFFRQLVETFVEEPWVQLLDFTRAQRIDKSFVSDDYERSEADLIYKVPLKNSEQSIYFYLLLEFQSTVPRLMALRIGQYLLSAKEELQRTHNQHKMLPQIFPLVLYNGKERWTAPTRLRDLIEQVVDIGDYGIDVHYLTIIENEYPLERLLREANLVSTLFMAEAYYERDRVIQQLIKLYDQDDPKVVSVLANWFQQMVLHKRIPTEDLRLLEREYRSKEELQAMIVEAILKEEEEIRKESKDEGIKLGKDEGIKLGKDEGIKLGKDEGKYERNREIARNMTTQNYSLAAIANVLSIPEAEVQILLTEATAL